METITNIYSDESSHINDGSSIMLLGAIWTDPETAKKLAANIKLVKLRHEVTIRREIKWTKVSIKKLEYYKELIDLFIDDDNINYRAVIVDKTTLDHEKYNHTHDDFYYIMQYYLVRNIAEKRSGPFRIFLDYKDAWSNIRCKELSEYLKGTAKLSSKVFSTQPVRSHEVSALQMADLITGAVMYANKARTDNDSVAKLELVKYIEDKVGQKLTLATPYEIEKFNIFIWESRNG